MKIELTQEKRGEVERVMQEFKGKLSEKQILIGTAQAINSTLTKSVARVNKRIKEKYNIKQKYLSRQASVYPKASSNNLYGGIRVNEARIPLIAFKPKQSGSSIAVPIHKGRTKYIRNSFIATMLSGHEGVFSRGEYVKKTFIGYTKSTPRGVRYTAESDYMKQRITQIMGPAVFTMAISKEVSEDVSEFMGNEVSDRVHGILTAKVEKIRKANG